MRISVLIILHVLFLCLSMSQSLSEQLDAMASEASEKAARATTIPENGYIESLIMEQKNLLNELESQILSQINIMASYTPETPVLTMLEVEGFTLPEWSYSDAFADLEVDVQLIRAQVEALGCMIHESISPTAHDHHGIPQRQYNLEGVISKNLEEIYDHLEFLHFRCPRKYDELVFQLYETEHGAIVLDEILRLCYLPMK